MLDLVERLPHRLGDLLRGGGAPQLLSERGLLLRVLAQELLDVHGQTNDARLVGQGAGDGLAYPPDRVSREARAPPRLELSHGVQQPKVALFDEVEEGEAAM